MPRNTSRPTPHDVVALIPLVKSIAWKQFRHVPDHVAAQEDLLQVGMIAVMKAAKRWAPDGAPFPQYASIRAYGAMQDYLRQQTPGGRNHVGEYFVCSLDEPLRNADADGGSITLGDTIPVEDHPADPLIVDAITSAVRGLPLDVQSAFELAVEEDLESVEIGRIMGVSESLVCQWLGRARDAVRCHPAVADLVTA